jgi:hypothetical protein
VSSLVVAVAVAVAVGKLAKSLGKDVTLPSASV